MKEKRSCKKYQLKKEKAIHRVKKCNKSGVRAFKRVMVGTAIENTQDGLLAQTRKEIRCL